MHGIRELKKLALQPQTDGTKAAAAWAHRRTDRGRAGAGCRRTDTRDLDKLLLEARVKRLENTVRELCDWKQRCTESSSGSEGADGAHPGLPRTNEAPGMGETPRGTYAQAEQMAASSNTPPTSGRSEGKSCTTCQR